MHQTESRSASGWKGFPAEVNSVKAMTLHLAWSGRLIRTASWWDVHALTVMQQHMRPRWAGLEANGRREGLTYLCVSVGGAWVQCGWGRSGCTRCRCSCGRRRAPPCAAAEPSGSGSASRTAGRRWPCPSLHTENSFQSVLMMFIGVRPPPPKKSSYLQHE